MKTPDEIKKGLAYCARLVCPLDECPFYKIEGSCALAKNLEALAYIQQLERERDAAVGDMKNSRDCQCCKHYDVKWDEPCVHCDHDNNCFEWRGVKEE
jgi:hypothetical protein